MSQTYPKSTSTNNLPTLPKELVSQLTASSFTESTIAGYRWSQHQSHYGGIQQQWLVVESKERQESDFKRLEKNLDKAKTEATRQLLLLQVDSVKQVSNLTDERLRTLSFFPAICQAYDLIH